MMVVAWVYGIMGFTGYDINPQTVTIGALALGLGVDYAVHISIRMEEEAEHDPFATEQMWVERSISTTGRAMFGAALTTAGGFSVLNLSSLLPPFVWSGLRGRHHPCLARKPGHPARLLPPLPARGSGDGEGQAG